MINPTAGFSVALVRDEQNKCGGGSCLIPPSLCWASQGVQMVEMAACRMLSQRASATLYRVSHSASEISVSGDLNNVLISSRRYGCWGSVVLKPSKRYGALRAGNGPSTKGLRVVAQAKNGAGKQAERKSSKGVQVVPEPLRTFPWQQVVARFGERILELLWTSCGWLLVPIVAVSALSEIAYTLAQNRDFLIPIGLVVGSALAGIVRETALELSTHIQDRTVPWHLVICMVFFLLVKLPGPNYPYWARCLVPHIGTGGAWQTLLYLRAWRKERHGAAASAPGGGRA